MTSSSSSISESKTFQERMFVRVRESLHDLLTTILIMNKKYLYILDHFEPEQCGIWNIVAENDEQCFDLICETILRFLSFRLDEYEWKLNEKNIRDSISEARKFEFEHNFKCGILEVFIQPGTKSNETARGNETRRQRDSLLRLIKQAPVLSPINP